ncbi:oxidoreductase [Salmonella enterica subsp. enterica serovar Shubra]|nr:oxidoreductase [Salmonella enterica subsp. enterica serovar Shubra]
MFKFHQMFLFLILCVFSKGVLSEQSSFELVTNGSKKTITMSNLEELPQFTFRTSTNYTGEDAFTGVKFDDFIKRYHVNGEKVRVFAWDGYSFSMPLNELKKYNVIIAYKKGGKLMDAESLGPFALVYPRDLFPELNRVDADAKTIWQLRVILVK